ncbi:hypothetical protein WA026_005920 [Henosepilachna vigintioctopunctata]|uniref:Calcyclin-binding protein n=1 Tax=Henosepilachna vigintioctopunctata TaxID=420089 RepID=A0AAW1TUB1_9CUCU
MEHKVKELKQDVAELETLLQQAKRQRVKDVLSIEVRKLASELIKLEDILRNETTVKTPLTSLQPSAVKRYQVKLNNYGKFYSILCFYLGWDQSSKFVKFFVTLPAVQTIPSENVVCKFTNKSLELEVKDLGNKDYNFVITKLLNNIDPDASNWKVKTDMVVINAAKVDSTNWSHVTELEKKASDAKSKKLEMDKSGAAEDNLMSLMRNMYEQGDDEMKRTIAKAWTEGQHKKSELGL